ncbi:MAG: isoprenylcysteine carboxylmethyltransferase family protein, partial [Pseudomonadota bacterium]
MRHLDLPPVWFGLMAALGWGLGTIFPALGPGGLQWLGLGVGAVGAALILWTALGFLRGRTPIEPRQTPRTLLTSGPFRVSRNPIYLGMLVLLIGSALWLGSWPAFAGAAL